MYQINKNSLFTNYRVNKFIPNMSPLCSYCKIKNETVSELFINCEMISDLWTKLYDWFLKINIKSSVNKNDLLFGITEESYDSINNYIIMITKQYIWKNKFNDTPVNLVACKKFIKSKLGEVKDAFEYTGDSRKFDRWILVYEQFIVK